MKIVERFEIPYYQYLDETSQITGSLPFFAQESKKLIELYRWMVLTRLFDQKAIALQRTGKLGTYPSTRGQEAAFVGLGHALSQGDILIPYYRDLGALIQHGATLTDILLYWGGDERGNSFASSHASFPYSVPIGSQLLYAAGVAAALIYQQKPQAVVCVCGDGATSQGDFYEAINIAGIWRLPLVLVICNNEWAISISRQQQTAAQTLAQKAIAGGIHGEQVDGNDVIAVRERVATALQKARQQHLPSVIELLCYRHSDHTTADDASRYEDQKQRESHWKNEPLSRLRLYLEKENAWSMTQEEELVEACQQEIAKAVNMYLNYSAQKPVAMFDYLYAELPRAYQEQYESLEQIGAHYDSNHPG